MRFKLAMSFRCGGSSGVEESAQFGSRVNIGDKRFGQLWHCCRQWRSSDQAAADRITIEAVQKTIPALPTAGDWAGSGKEGMHSLCLDIGDVDLFSHKPAKSFQS